MAIIPYRPFWDIDSWFESDGDDWLMPRGWQRASHGLMAVPKIDIYEEGDNLIADVALPGVKENEVSAEVRDNMLSIEVNQKEEKEEKGKEYYRKEISAGYFKRTVGLPVEVMQDKAEAVFEKGMLKVKMPKTKPVDEEPKRNKIPIKSKE